MRHAYRLAIVAAVWLCASCGDPGAPQYSGTPPPVAAAFGTCAFCHENEAQGVLPVAAVLTCTTCHADARPGYVGPGHRAIPTADLVPAFPQTGHHLEAGAVFGACAFCHSDQSAEVLAFAETVRCETCHVAAVTADFGPRHRSLPDGSLVPQAPPAPHQPGPERAWGACSLCHNDVAQQLQDLGPAAAGLACSTCHSEQTPGRFAPGHFSLPPPAVVPEPAARGHAPGAERAWGACALCHNAEASALQELLGSESGLACSTCHQEQTPGRFGAGHFSLPPPAVVPEPAANPHAPGVEGRWGSCALCHNGPARALQAILGGPSDLRCETCHADALPGLFVPGHRRRPSSLLVPDPPPDPHRPGAAAARSGSCAYCHSGLAANVAPVTAELPCTVCHREGVSGVFGPGHRRQPDATLVPAFLGADHALGPWQPFGACAYCHRDLAERVAASGATELGCVICHSQPLSNFGPGHRSLPEEDLVPSFVGAGHDSGAARVFGTCAFCHNATSNRALQFTHGNLEIECEECHAAAEGGRYGKGHQTILRCVDCHGTERETHHDPASGTDFECASCHEPHGSANLFLIREQIATPLGVEREVRFENLRGQDDAGFTSQTQPGSGLCEVCHTQTRFFRSDGSGAAHFTFPCFTCHPHALGFSVRP